MYHHCPELLIVRRPFHPQVFFGQPVLRFESDKAWFQLLDLQYQKAKINFWNTVDFVQRRLANFPKAVEFIHVEVRKEDFSLCANVPQNWSQVIPFPNVDKYMAEEKLPMKNMNFCIGMPLKSCPAVELLTFGSKCLTIARMMLLFCANVPWNSAKISSVWLQLTPSKGSLSHQRVKSILGRT